MLPLMESSDNEEEETPVLLADHRRDRNKVTKCDKQILENINKKITTCANNLTHSCPVLQATCETIHEVHVALKGIRSHETGIAALKLNTIQSLDNLEARWTELSSLLAEDQPLEYSTTHHFASTMHHYSIIIQIAIFLGVFIAGVINASQNDRDFIMGILNILLFQAVQPLDGGLVMKTLFCKCQTIYVLLYQNLIWITKLSFTLSVRDAIVHTLLISLQEKQPPNTPHIAPIIQIPHQINVDSLCSDTMGLERRILGNQSNHLSITVFMII